VWVLAMVFLLGYTFDQNVSILVVMVVGMAVDYAVHFAHFYNEMGGDRYEKARGALHGVGLPVFGGAITTAGAGIPLFFASIIFFKLAGIMIFFVAFWGLFFSFFQLLPLLMICGPSGKTGDLEHIFCSWRKATEPPSGAHIKPAPGGVIPREATESVSRAL
jgi:predicted RND superfamily exporter protein